MPPYSQLLAQIPMFEHLSDEELGHLSGLMQQRRYAKGEVIFHKGDVGTALFIVRRGEVAIRLSSSEGREVILAMLSLIDACLVASLMVMVMLTGYENYVSRLNHEDAPELAWLGKVDTGSLKVKIASAIIAISSIHLLQVFLNAQQYDNQKIMWSTLIHLAFVLSAFSLAVVDRIAVGSKPGKPSGADKPAD